MFISGKIVSFDITARSNYIVSMLLTIIVPVYNEEKTLTQIFDKLLRLPIEKQIIAVDDASTDNSSELLEGYSRKGQIVFLSHEKNRGKGFAIRTGLEKATGNYTVIQDADLEYDPDDIIRMLQTARDNDAEAVFGSRITNPGSGKSYQRYYWGGRFLTVLANLLYGLGITDESTCYKMVRTDLLRSLKLQCRRFEFCPELVARLGKKKIRILEIPINYYPRKIGEGKKIRWYDGAIAIWILLKHKFLP